MTYTFSEAVEVAKVCGYPEIAVNNLPNFSGKVELFNNNEPNGTPVIIARKATGKYRGNCVAIFKKA